MNNNHETEETEGADRSHTPFNLAAFLIAFFFVWLVFDNLALGLIFGVLFSGGSEIAQRSAAKKSD